MGVMGGFFSLPIRYGKQFIFILFFLREMAKETAYVATTKHLFLLSPFTAITTKYF